jgi:hypothetical protein
LEIVSRSREADVDVEEMVEISWEKGLLFS